MLRFIRHPDIGQNTILFVLLLMSAGLSGYCGYKLAEGQNFFIQWASAGLLFGIPFGLSDSLIRRERYELAGNGRGYIDARRAVWFFLLANIATDFGAGVTIRDLKAVASNNANTVAKNARKEFQRINDRIAVLTKSGDTTVKFLKPEGYDGLIKAKKEEMRQESRKGCSKPPCRGPDYLEDARELAALEANQATAAELSKLYAALPAAQAAVEKNKIKSNTAIAPILAFARLATANFDVGSRPVQWGQILFVLFITIVVNAGIYFKSADAGRRQGPMLDLDLEKYEKEPENWWLEDQRPVRPPREKPIPLKSEPAPDAEAAAAEWSRQNTVVLDKIVARVQARQAASA